MIDSNQRRVKGETRPEPVIRALLRGLDIIEAMSGQYEGMSLSQVAEAVGLDRATARRFLLTLLNKGYLRQDGRKFFLAPRILNLGYAYLASSPLREIAFPYLKQVAETTQQGCSLGILDGDEALYLGSVQSASRIVARQIGAGVRLPTYCTSIGRILLGSLTAEELKAHSTRVPIVRHTVHTKTHWRDVFAAVEQGRAQGWIFVDQEVEDGLRSIAVPIRDRDSKIIAGMNVSALASRLDAKADIARSLKILQRAAAGIEQALRLR